MPSSLLTAAFPGLVLGSLVFVTNTKEATRLFEDHEADHHKYTDNVQIHASCKPRRDAGVPYHLNQCAEAEYTSSWCTSRQLQINYNKFEIVRFGSQHKIACQDLTLMMCSESLKPTAWGAILVFALALD
jgi:hypothetical protein